MHHLKAFLFLFALSITYTVISACHDANAGDGASQAQLAALTARVEALEAQQHRVLAAAPTSMAKALEADLAPIGTLLSFDGAPSVASSVNVRSDSGYLFAASLDTGEVQGPGGNASGLIYFSTADCSGQAFVGAGDIGAYASRQGAMFRIEQQDGSDQYYMVVAGTEPLAPATYGSFYSWASGCTTQDAVLPAFPTLPNDPAVSGVESKPVAVSATVG